MADEEDELILRVRLDDQATASLQKLRGSMQEMSGGGGRGAERIAASTRRATEDASKMGAAFGRAAGFAGVITAEITKLGINLVSKAADLGAFAEKFVALERSARRAGVETAQFKTNLSTLKMGGVDTESASRQLTAYSETLADLALQGSETRKRLIQGLRGPELTDMIQHITDVMTGSQEEGLNKIKKYGEDIRGYFERQGMPEVGAARQKQFYAAWGIPDIDRVKKTFQQIGDEEKRLMATRVADAEKYYEHSHRMDTSWSKIAESLTSIAFKVLPINETMAAMAASAEAMLKSFQGAEKFLNLPVEKRMEELRNRPGGDPWQRVPPGFKPPDRTLDIWDVFKFKNPGTAAEHEKAIKDNTQQLEDANKRMERSPAERNMPGVFPGFPGASPLSYSPGGGAAGGGGGGSFGGIRGGGFGQLLGAAGTSRMPISGSSVGPGVGAGAGATPAGGGGVAGQDPMTEFIKQREGFQAKATWDAKQYSVGYGTKATGPGETITREAAAKRLSDELGKARASVDKFAPNAPQGVKEALTSLTYNAGPGWQSAGLGEAIRAGEYDKAKGIFGQYTKSEGKVLPGLVARRQAELQYWDKPGGAAGIPAAAGGIPAAAGSGAVTHRGSGQMVPDITRQQMEYAGLMSGVTTNIAHGIEPGHARHRPGAPAGDVDLHDPETGRKLDANNPEDQQKMAAYIEHAAAAGASGIGFGGAKGGYMGSSRMHIGGGTPAVWGHKGKGGAEPQWVRDAYNRGRARLMSQQQVSEAIDRSKIDRNQQTVKVDGTGKLDVNVNAPAGTTVRAEGSGLFKRTTMRRKTSMEPAATGPDVASQEE